MTTPETFWRRCSSCKREIRFAVPYWTCSVSTCNRKGSSFVFCSVACFPDPARRHSEEWQRDRKRIEGEVPSPFRPADFTPSYVTLRDLGGGHLVAA